ncbi:DUF3015 family protein [Helicobacter mastomyrinus]|uniref:DUF3015 family protein n=1 Tax=Helicobacter mastomyrinus TaxID=287948 RepID=A0ABZ3F539_9HELI|nr:DUF3015 family protein [uncultured Helicobacter sp.]
MKKILVSLVLSTGLVSGALAAANTNTGCGLGSLIIDKKGILWNVLQATTNATFFNQTFGITSGTSGCKSGKVAMDSRTEEFVAANMDALSQEIAQGRGEHLDTLVELLNVSDKEAFKVALQENYHKLYTSKDAQSADVLDGAANL